MVNWEKKYLKYKMKFEKLLSGGVGEERDEWYEYQIIECNDIQYINIDEFVFVEAIYNTHPHKLHPFIHPTTHYWCEICRKRFEKKTLVYTDEGMTYTLCQECYLNDRKKNIGSPLRKTKLDRIPWDFVDYFERIGYKVRKEEQILDICKTYHPKDRLKKCEKELQKYKPVVKYNEYDYVTLEEVVNDLEKGKIINKRMSSEELQAIKAQKINTSAYVSPEDY